MRVFVTGASGHIASAVIPELLTHGHSVLGLARSDEAATAVEHLGAEVVRGSLDDHAGLAETAAACDGVIHLAFKHAEMNAGDFEGAMDDDFAAVRALGEALVGSGKPFVGTAGTIACVLGGVEGVGTEADVLPGGPRIDTENWVIDLAERGVRSSVIRLAPTVHSALDHHGFIPGLIDFARSHEKAGYVGDGANCWPAVHTLDAAVLYRLALEGAPAGSRLHGAAEGGIPFKEIAEAIGRGLGLPAVEIPADEIGEYFSYLAFFAGLDNRVSSEATQKLLGWQPRQVGLLADLAEGHYFA